ncbi:MAG: hypothetical protein Q9207_003152 [Kuettlingeria erythrocarpa]
MQVPAAAAAATAPLVAPYGYGSTSCGYCNSKNGRVSIRASLTGLQPAVYQHFVDRGWRREKQRRKNHFDLHLAVHEAESRSVKRPIHPRTKEPVEPAHTFEVQLEPDSYSDEKYALFEDYQRHVHRERPSEISKHGFKRFLCSGLGQSSRRVKGEEQKLGSYHQCYRLNGRLVAMGVLDLLPGYHQDVKDWYFGKLSALREIDLAVEGSYKFYYMDADYLDRLSSRNYVSMSLERQLHLPAHKIANIKDLGLEENSLKRLLAYQRDPGTGKVEDGAHRAGMPGLIPLAVIEEQVDLARWQFQVGDRLARMRDLRDWANWDIQDPHSLKRVVAELAAALGPALANQLIVKLVG